MTVTSKTNLVFAVGKTCLRAGTIYCFLPSSVISKTDLENSILMGGAASPVFF